LDILSTWQAWEQQHTASTNKGNIYFTYLLSAFFNTLKNYCHACHEHLKNYLINTFTINTLIITSLLSALPI